ncbi:MAG: hypothetical protein ACE5DR_03045, partial [Thermodesulfobacteriota bacterium]
GSALLCKDRLLDKVNSTATPAAFLDNESIVISDGKDPLLYKKITGETDVKLALAGIEAEGPEISTFYCCGARAMEVVPAGREAISADEWDERFTGVWALSLQAMEGWRAAVNFRKGEFADTEAFDRARKGFKVTLALMLLVAVLWGGLVFLQSSRLSGEAAHLKNNILLAYKRAFPGERTIQDPFYQLEIKLSEQAKDMGLMGRGLGALDNLSLLAKAGGAADITLYQLSMRGMRVTAKGKAPSFEKAEKFKAELIKLNAFNSPVLTDVKKSVSGGVTFSIALDIHRKGIS